MAMYIDENNAKQAISNIVTDVTTDFSINILKRKHISAIKKNVIYGLKVKQDISNEDLFNTFMELELKNDNGLHVQESEIFMENGTLKELFLISCTIEIDI